MTFSPPPAPSPKPKPNGLVLAGGRSTRMGRDKGLIDYHGAPQREVAFNLLRPFCNRVFLSLNAGQATTADPRFPVLVDETPDAGPLGGLLTAFHHDPTVAWLTVPCDLPFLTEKTISILLQHRDPARMATAFRGADGWPEPLVTLWEPAALPFLRQAAEHGDGPRRVLLHVRAALVDVPDFKEFLNANEPLRSSGR